jgi:hypothetical protein
MLAILQRVFRFWQLFQICWCTLSLCIRWKSVSDLSIKIINKSWKNPCYKLVIQPELQPWILTPITTNISEIRKRWCRGWPNLLDSFCLLYLVFIPNMDYSRCSMKFLYRTTGKLMFTNNAINPHLYVWRFKELNWYINLRGWCMAGMPRNYRNWKQRGSHSVTSYDMQGNAEEIF